MSQTTREKKKKKDGQHVREMDKQMDHMCYWRGSRIPQAAMKPLHPLLKQTDTVSEPSGPNRPAGQKCEKRNEV